jgi:hypothetical protein
MSPGSRLAFAGAVSLALLATACADPRDGTPGNPPGTAAVRAFDREAGTNQSGAFPGQADGTPNNPRGTGGSRMIDRATGSNLSGAYPAPR